MMSARIVAEGAFKILGVFILVTIVIQLPVLVTGGTFQGGIGGFVLSWAIEAAAGAFLILRGDTVARRIISESANFQVNIGALELQRIGFALVGLTTLISGIKDGAAVV